MRNYAGRIPSGSPSEVHKDLAREAFESGRSLNQLCLEAILAREALKKYDPWKDRLHKYRDVAIISPREFVPVLKP